MSIVFQNSQYKVILQNTLNEPVRLFLNTIHWGHRGTRYRRPVTAEAAKRLFRPWVFSIESANQVIGSVVANQYSFSPGTSGFYFRYFASHPGVRGQAVLGLNARRVLTWLEAQQAPGDFSYAFLEKKNVASLKMVQHLGFRPFQTSLTLGFSRFFPKKNPRARALTDPAEQAKMTQLLQEYYQDHAFVHAHGWHHQNNYWILEEAGEVVAGVQVIPAAWEVVQMEGKMGSFLVRYGRFLPGVNRIFNPQNFQFLGFEGLYVCPGRESALLKLMEHVLATFQVHAALFWQDPTSPHYLGHRRDLGWLNAFVHGTGSWLMAKNLPDSLAEKPAYISCFDFV